MKLESEVVTTEEVKDWCGLHLLHFHSSSCSQKVRILLNEKGLDWQSHPVDLMREEHITPWYLGINPRGVVPVLVHDGAVHIESNDILEYLDSLPSGAQPYFPATDAERRYARASLDLENGLHGDLRNITMAYLVPDAATKRSEETLDRYECAGPPDEKRAQEVAWWRAHAAHGIPGADRLSSARAFEAAFEGLEKRLAEQPWLLGDRISLLEIAWFISIHRLVSAGYPLERHPKLMSLYQRLLERPAFAREVRAPGLPGLALRVYQGYRRLTGTTLREDLK